MCVLESERKRARSGWEAWELQWGGVQCYLSHLILLILSRAAATTLCKSPQPSLLAQGAALRAESRKIVVTIHSNRQKLTENPVDRMHIHEGLPRLAGTTGCYGTGSPTYLTQGLEYRFHTAKVIGSNPVVGNSIFSMAGSINRARFSGKKRLSQSQNEVLQA